jgi:deoxyribose-phosphate aldolase
MGNIMDHSGGENGAPNETGGQPAETYETLAQIIDHLLLRADLSEDEVAEGCRVAREYGVSSVVVRPSDVDQVVRWMNGSTVRVASTVGYPDGCTTTGAKLYEGRDLLRRGVRELDMTINIGKMISRQFQYVEMELLQMVKSCQESGALLKVDLASKYLTEDLKIIATKICKRIESHYLCVDYNLRDMALVYPLLKDRVQLKTTAGIASLAEALEVRQAGCTRLGTTATALILDGWKAHLAQQVSGAAAEG